ncbi:retrovirus-related pol polyprotein from transposon TNT 1-94 [Tanacetum coccineum]
MLLAGSRLTKEDKESQLYDEFKWFKMLPGENIIECYVRFHKLVNDMRNIRMTMPNIQLNSKFVNNMSPEWDRFVTAIKLNKGLKETNHEQLATLPQTKQSTSNLSNTRNQAAIQDGRVVQNVQGRHNQNQRYFARGNGAAGNGGAQNRAGMPMQDKMDADAKPKRMVAVLDEDELLFLGWMKHTDQNNSLLSEIENLKAQLKDNSKCVTIPDSKPKVLAPGRYPIDVEPIPPRHKNNREVHLHYIKRLKENVETLREIVEDANNTGTYPRKNLALRHKQNASTTSLRKKRVTFVEPCETSTRNTPTQVKHQKINSTNAPGISSTGIKGASAASSHEWRPTGRLLPLGKVVHIVLWYLDSGYSKHMTGDRSRLRNFMKKFIGTVRFRNDHFGTIMVMGIKSLEDSVISRVYYVEGLEHNLFSVGQFCDSDLEVAFKKHTCFIRELDGVDLIKGSHGTNLYTISVEYMMRSSPICLLSRALKNKSWLWHRRLNHLNFGTFNDLARKDLVEDYLG